MSTLGVGFLGGGPATQAIHLPTLATITDRFHVARVMDVNPVVAEQVAARCGARSSTDAAEIYRDPAVDIVAICSPNAFHAEQVIAACRAGKRAVLCEKPLAVTREEASAIAAASAETGTPVIVGTMHAFDPAYRAARAAWDESGDTATFVQSAIYLPGNDVFTDQATDPVHLPPAAPKPAPDVRDPAYQARSLRGAMLGLAIHDIPLVRDYYPAVGTLTFASVARPWGYALAMTNGDAAVELLAVMPGKWPPRWTFRAIGRRRDLRVCFPPSYVLSGSARAELASGDSTLVFERPVNGYEAMWQHVGAVARGESAPLFPLSQAVDDLAFALDLADAAERLLVPA
jgi:predicted dehydrogenase